MDDFREWLSDNLRYFMLGGGILLVVLVLFFGIRACTRIRRDSSETEAQNQEDTESGEKDSSGKTEDDGSPAENISPRDVPLEKADKEIASLLKDYFTAFGEEDLTELRSLVKDLSPSDEARINNSQDYIESYEVGDVYVQKGLTEDSYMVYACNNYIFSGIETPMPALAKLYVIKDSDGKWKVDGSAWEDADIIAYAKELEKNPDVVKLASDVQSKNDEAREADPALAEFLDGLGDEVIVPVGGEDGTVMTVVKQCNVRSEPSTDASVLGILDVGTEVKALETEGDWTKVEYKDQTAYIFSELLE